MATRATISRAGEDVGPARPRRRRLPHRPEVVVPARRTCSRATSCVNGDEGEPATFKDRMLVERDPHQLDRGHRSSRATRSSATTRFIYLRGEFALGARAARAGDRRRVRAGLRRQEHPRLRLRPRDRRAPRRRRVHLRRGDRPALESLEGERGMPRIKPPFPAVAGPVRAADGRQQRRDAVDRPAHHQRRAASGTPRSASNRSTGTRIFSVSGHVERPGNYEVELGMHVPRRSSTASPAASATASELKFFIPGGASSPWLLTDEHLDAPLDMDYVGAELEHDARLGRDHGVRRDHRPAARRVAARASSSPTSRAASARRAARASGWIEKVLYRMLARLRPARGPRPAARRRRQHRARRRTAPLAQTTICPLGPSVDVAASRASTGTSATRSSSALGAIGAAERGRR